MPPITDPNLLAEIQRQQQMQAPPVAPMPFPGALPPLRQPPAQRQAEERLQLDYEANRRAEESNRREAERLRIAQEEENRKRRTTEANAGVDTTASQDQAVGHLVMLTNSLATIDDVLKKAPDQLKPTLKEFGAQWLTNDNPTLVGFLQPEERQRAANAYRGAVESAIWLSTGAAAPADQVQRIYSTISPTASDKPGVLADKRRALLAYIAQAKVRAGPANLKAQEALDELAQKSGLIYGDIPDPEVERKLDTESSTKALEIPPQMQAEHDAFLRNFEPGKLATEQYIDFYQKLVDKYNFKGPINTKEAEDFVKGFNSGRPVGSIPLPETEKSAGEKLLGGVAGSDLGVGIKNFASAATFGLPELLAGKEGRIASELADKENPTSAVVGEIAGSVAPGIAAEKGVAALLTKFGIEPGSRAARIVADMLGNAGYSGITEYNQTGDIKSAALNAAMAIPATAAGRIVAKGGAELKPESYRQGLKDLGSQEIINDTGEIVGKIKPADLTTAQRAGFTGGEEFLSGLPGISPARQAAVASMNRHNAERAMAKAGLQLPKNLQPGQATNAYMDKTLKEEYNKLAPSIKGPIDKTFTNSIAAIRYGVLKAPRKGAEVDPAKAEMWQYIENALDDFQKGKKFNYESYKKLTSQLREWQDFWAKSTVGPADAPSPIANEMARVADQIRQRARELVSRANPKAGERLKRIDSAWAHKLRIEEASKGAAAQERGIYAPSEYLSAISRMDTSKGKKLFSHGKSFDQPYAQSAQEVMGGKPAKGGSVLATGALGYTVGGTILSPLLIANYAPGIKRLTQLLTDGRLGTKLDGTLPKDFVQKYPELKELPSDIIKQVISTYIRQETVGK